MEAERDEINLEMADLKTRFDNLSTAFTTLTEENESLKQQIVSQEAELKKQHNVEINELEQKITETKLKA